MANQAWQITAPGTLTLTDLGADRIPSPGPRQALVRIAAVSLNYRDVLVVDHNPAYPQQTGPNLIPCSDGAGVVEAAGPESRWRRGDRVYVHPNTWIHGYDQRGYDFASVMGGGDQDGSLRRWVVWDDERLVGAPTGYAMEEVATFFTAGVTAWRALFHGATKLEPGMTVLTQGTGGVSCFAIMIAAACGATVVATSSSDEKLQVAKELGATHLVNYRTHPAWATEVLKVTDGKGVDIVVEVVGAQTIEESVKATRFGGHISLVGILSENPHQPVNIMSSLLFGAKTSTSIASLPPNTELTMRTVQGSLGAGSKQMSDEFAAFAQKHRLRCPIAQLFEFAQADRAMEAVAKLSAVGKVVIKV